MQKVSESRAPSPKRTFVMLNLFTVGLFAVLLLITLRFVEDQHGTKIEATLKAEASALANRTAETLRTSVENLRAIASFLTAFEDADYASFSAFAGHYLELDSGLLILEWQPRVTEQGRETFIKAARRNGLPTFTLWEPGPDDKPIPARRRPLHVPVYYMLSKHPGTDTTGLDLAWSDERMASKWRARDSGQPQSSGFFPVVTGADSQIAPAGLAITLPIFHGGIVPDHVGERRRELQGYLAGVYSLESIIGPQLDELAARGFNVRISDGTNSGIGIERRAGLPSEHHWQTPFTLFGNDWRIALTSSQQRFAGEGEPVWRLLPGMLVLVGVMVLVFLQLLQRKNLDLHAAQYKLERALQQVRESESVLRELAKQDPLTGLHNRRAFIEQIHSETRRASRHAFASSLLMLDIDRFKQINDSRGHPAGDEVLKHFAELCRTESRTTDMIARLGGEEFGILLPHTALDEAEVIAERIRQSVADHEVRLEGETEPLRFTVSIGLASTGPDTGIEQLMSRADRALYRAKQAGRNCVRSDGDQPA